MSVSCLPRSWSRPDAGVHDAAARVLERVREVYDDRGLLRAGAGVHVSQRVLREPGVAVARGNERGDRPPATDRCSTLRWQGGQGGKRGFLLGHVSSAGGGVRWRRAWALCELTSIDSSLSSDRLVGHGGLRADRDA